MTRIIAGTYGGHRLKTPSSAATRPTSDRVREAVFSTLTTWDVIAGAEVLDLFAGTGALALEALSRGAARAVAVEEHQPTARLITANANALGAPLTVVAANALTYPARMTTDVDLVFVDPPYALETSAVERCLSALAHHLAPGAVVVLERSSRSPDPEVQELSLIRSKNYGETRITYLEPHPTPQP